MPTTPQQHLEQAYDDAAAAERFALEGNLEECKTWQLMAILHFLRFATRVEEGLRKLEDPFVAKMIASAAANTAPGHPTDLLDAAHVAIIVGERRTAEIWLEIVSRQPAWSAFWRNYAAELLCLLTHRPIDAAPVNTDLPGQAQWVPYFHLMRSISTGQAVAAPLKEVAEAFHARQATPADPGLLDGRPGDPIRWDWRLEAITRASRPSTERSGR